MCKFAIFNSHEMTNPVAGFFLGVCVILVQFTCQASNIIVALEADKINVVLSKFVAFKLLMEV